MDTPDAPAVDIVIPVYNEERDLERSVLRLYSYLRARLPYTFRITIADNASTDSTWPIALRLADTLPAVVAVRLARTGRGNALHQAWSASDATVLAYMDVDLATDLAALLPLLAPLLTGHSDVAIGTRLARGSRVVRGAKREIISRTYNAMLRLFLRVGFSDAQCGFKAIRADRAAELLPLVADRAWFFDTELLVLAERAGMRIHEVPVDWTDDPDSRVNIIETARGDVLGIARIGWGLARGRIPLRSIETVPAPPRLVPQLIRFIVIGVVSTLAYIGLFWLLRGALSAQWANLLALLATAVGNTAANRRITFEVRGPHRRLVHQGQGLVVFVAGLGMTAGALALLQVIVPAADRGLELVVLLGASVAATMLRFLLYRAWIFPAHSNAEEA